MRRVPPQTEALVSVALRATAIAALAALAALAFPREARADDETGVLVTHHQGFESPQNFNIELRFSPYSPRVDYDPSLTGNPYTNTFGSSPRLEFAMEFDWEALRIPHLGTIGPGISAGYTQASALARLANPPTTCTPGNTATCFSAENTAFAIFPFYLVAVLRADVLDREAHIPLVPYIKGGLGMALWRAYNDGGTSSVPNGQGGTIEGKGHTVGAQLALGLSFDLNVIDEHTARNFDNALGVNHTYVFAETYVSALTGLGQSHAMYVGNGSFTAPALAFGLAFEF
jgi:hypothetical protein